MRSDLAKRLLPWFSEHKRILPWRNSPDPYRVWLSEVMLQQTRVAAVIPYYEKFLERFPTPEALAIAEEPELLRYWAGLGYYSRARNLQKAAQEIQREGGFPATSAGWRKLAGVGEYTAAAVASIAFGEAVAVLDGNVARVAARLVCESGDIGNPKIRGKLREVVQNQIDTFSPGDYNQALMELGATICLPRSPKCLICPINDICCARKRGLENSLPTKLKKNRVIEEEKEFLLLRRGTQLALRPPDKSSRRLRGFWELPNAQHGLLLRNQKHLGEFRHAIVNHIYRVTVRQAKLIGELPDPYEWISSDQLSELPLSTMARKSLELEVTSPAGRHKSK